MNLETKENEHSETPAAMSLLAISEKDKVLDDTLKEQFHTLVAKILYLSKLARPDILLATTLLCTRVQCPGTKD